MIEVNYREKCLELLQIIQSKEEQISKLQQNQSLNNCNDSLAQRYFSIYSNTLKKISDENLCVPNKYETKQSKGNIAVYLSDFMELPEQILKPDELKKYRKFIVDCNLVNERTFKAGGTVIRSEDKVIRIVRINENLYKLFINGETDENIR